MQRQVRAGGDGFDAYSATVGATGVSGTATAGATPTGSGGTSGAARLLCGGGGGGVSVVVGMGMLVVWVCWGVLVEF